METIVNELREYRSHYIWLKITSEPPFPSDDSTITATVEVYDGKPPSKVVLSITPDGNKIESWEEEIDNYDSEDTLTELIQDAKDRVDTRRRQQYAVKESATIAMERELDE